jgi:hypothetical protein
MRSGAPEWTKEEFATLLEAPDLPAPELATHLPRRSVGSIESVRAFVHSFHRGQNTSGLSKVMLEAIAAHVDEMTCAECGERFGGH